MPLISHPLSLGRRVPGVWLSPLAAALDRARLACVDRVVGQEPDRFAQAREIVTTALNLATDDAATAAIDAQVDREARLWLQRLRGVSLRSAGAGLNLAAALDAVVRSERGEILESRWLPESLRRLEMWALDRVNRQFGSYPLWAERVAAAVADVRTPHLVDLAAGSGGFLRWLAAHRPDRGWRLTATDYEAQFVAQGHEIAARAGLPVQFERRDATRIGAFDPPADLFVCTQSVHHMPPGVVLRMLASAVTSAPRGILVVDVARGFGHALGIGLGTAISLPFPPLVLDGMQSARRGYAGAELVLLARLAGARVAEVAPLGPVHLVLRASAS